MRRPKLLQRTNGGEQRMHTKLRSGNPDCSQPGFTLRWGRTLAVVVCGIASLLLLALLLGQAHGDFDDDDGHPVHITCCPPIQCAPAAPPTYGCAEEYLGYIAGVHWYDVWKNCNTITYKCSGGVIEGVPFDEDGHDICYPSGDDCASGDCMQENSRATAEEDPLQEFFAKKNAKLTVIGRDPMKMEVKDEGFGVVARTESSRAYAFKLLSITTTYGGEQIKVRLVGVEIDPDDLDNGDLIRRAGWSKDEPDIGLPSTKSKVQHFIDVELPGADTTVPFPGGETERHRVCTVDRVTHHDQ